MNYCPNHCLLSINRDLSFKHCVLALIVQSIGSLFLTDSIFLPSHFSAIKTEKKKLMAEK
jgi:hypothetical protein